MSQKNMIRMTSFATALILSLIAVIISLGARAGSYRSQLELSQVRALQEVSSQLNALTADLQKTAYAGTPAQMAMISAKAYSSAGNAKAALGSLPVGDADLTEVYRFLSQAGDYALFLSRKSMNGEEITWEERENQQALVAYATALNSRISELEANLGSGRGSAQELLQEVFAPGSDAVAVAAPDMEPLKTEGYPTLIYDGPFSDHMLQHRPLLTQNKDVIALEKARAIAASYAGVDENTFTHDTMEESVMPSYTFSDGTRSIGVTRQGGFVAWMLNGREIAGRSLSIEDGRVMARLWLESVHAQSLKETYYELSNGILTVNFAYHQDDVTCYTDLIKVGVAMDNGEVVFYDARGFISNHHPRNLKEPVLSSEEAAESVSPLLEVRGRALALVPTAGKNEVLTWEFLCQDQEGRNVLVYVNTQTGAEEQILILLQSETGTLTI